MHVFYYYLITCRLSVFFHFILSSDVPKKKKSYAFDLIMATLKLIKEYEIINVEKANFKIGTLR